jgi:hypothetical protein
VTDTSLSEDTGLFSAANDMCLVGLFFGDGEISDAGRLSPASRFCLVGERGEQSDGLVFGDVCSIGFGGELGESFEKFVDVEDDGLESPLCQYSNDGILSDPLGRKVLSVFWDVAEPLRG